MVPSRLLSVAFHKYSNVHNDPPLRPSQEGICDSLSSNRLKRHPLKDSQAPIRLEPGWFTHGAMDKRTVWEAIKRLWFTVPVSFKPRWSPRGACLPHSYLNSYGLKGRLTRATTVAKL